MVDMRGVVMTWAMVERLRSGYANAVIAWDTTPFSVC